MAFPQTFDTFTTKNAGDTIAQAHVNDLQTAIVSIEQKIGTSSTSLTASTNTALLGQGASVTGYAVIRLDNASLVQGTLTAARGGTGRTNTNTANGALILNASGNVAFTHTGIVVITTAAYAVNTIYTVPHGLGAMPSRVDTTLLCLSTDAEWVADDELFTLPNFYDGTSLRMFTVGADATNVTISTESHVPQINNKTTAGGSSTITAAKWCFRVRCGL